MSTRVSGRHVHGRQDQDFNVAGSLIVDYPNFTVVDLDAAYRLRGQQSITVSIGNLLDTF